MPSTRTLPGAQATLRHVKVRAARSMSTAGSVSVPFGTIKGLLSTKPLRRPNRVRPLDSRLRHSR